MLVNALFPTRDIGNDPAKIRDWAQAAEELGYHSIEVADHVFGAAQRKIISFQSVAGGRRPGKFVLQSLETLFELPQ